MADAFVSNAESNPTGDDEGWEDLLEQDVSPELPSVIQEVTGPVVAVAVSGSTFAASGRIRCTSCNHATRYCNVPLVNCGSCGMQLSVGSQAPRQVLCYSCRAPNLVESGVVHVACGRCSTQFIAPGA